MILLRLHKVITEPSLFCKESEYFDSIKCLKSSIVSLATVPVCANYWHRHNGCIASMADVEQTTQAEQAVKISVISGVQMMLPMRPHWTSRRNIVRYRHYKQK